MGPMVEAGRDPSAAECVKPRKDRKRSFEQRRGSNESAAGLNSGRTEKPKRLTSDGESGLTFSAVLLVCDPLPDREREGDSGADGDSLGERDRSSVGVVLNVADEGITDGEARRSVNNKQDRKGRGKGNAEGELEPRSGRKQVAQERTGLTNLCMFYLN